MHLLMRGVAMHNASLIHQHLSRRMDVHSLQEQQPAPGFFSNIIVSHLFRRAQLYISMPQLFILKEGGSVGCSCWWSKMRLQAGLG